MEMIYSELYAVNKKTNEYYCSPLLEITYISNDVDKAPKTNNGILEKYEDEDLYTLNISFFDTFFDGLSDNTIYRLDSILDFANKYNNHNYISKEIWKPFLYTSNIQCNQIQKVINTHLKEITNDSAKNKLYKNYNAKDDNQKIVEQYYKNNKNEYNKSIATLQSNIYKKLSNEEFYNKISFAQKYKIKPTNKSNLTALSLMRRGLFGGYMNIDYKFQFNNELELLYTFLDCIFSSDYNYKIKKCKNCNNYFITMDTRTKHCSHCTQEIIKYQKQNYEDNDIVKIERRVSRLFYAENRLNETDKFIKDKNQMKKDLTDNKITELEYKNWLLSHYKTK